MRKLEDAICARCKAPFHRWVTKGQYVRKFCTHSCATTRRGTPEKRFFDRVEKQANGCWLWTGNKNNYGYGFIWINGKDITTHRFAYQHFIGPIPKGLLVRHRCDTPSCVNPEHLQCGTNLDNSADRVARGRVGRTGGYMPKTKAKALRALLQTDLTQQQIATLLGVAIKTVQRYSSESFQKDSSK